jgi:hypothetical protein
MTMDEREQLDLLVAIMFLIVGLESIRQREPNPELTMQYAEARDAFAIAMRRLGITEAMPPMGVPAIEVGINLVQVVLARSRELRSSSR